MNKQYMKKCFAIAIILLLVSVSVVPTTGRDIEQSSISPLYDGKTLYVGGSEPGNYTRICWFLEHHPRMYILLRHFGLY